MNKNKQKMMGPGFNIDHIVDTNWKDPVKLVERLCNLHNLNKDYFINFLLDNYNISKEKNRSLIGDLAFNDQFHQKYRKESLYLTLMRIADEVYEYHNYIDKFLKEDG